ncbi:MAG TPA: ribonuclease HI [Clostridia bacterium]|nr:ribonuclease HI [Clostridia bacterium]
MTERKILVYCDGGCRGNGQKNNIGGWGVVLQWGEYVKEFHGSVKDTTNNQMELTSIIEALKRIKNKDIPVEVVMDSKYVIKGITEWIHAWTRNGWVTSTKKPVENKDLWIELLSLKNQFKEISFSLCKGHAGNEGNNRADELANIAMDKIA